ncbi:hypothetical protein KFE25_007880, partial [Diacronema lutheri]
MWRRCARTMCRAT